MQYRIGFGYEQAEVRDADRCRGLYVAKGVSIVFSEDVEPTPEDMAQIERMVVPPVEADALLARISELEDTMSFYANPGCWTSPSTGFAAQYDREPSLIEKDRGANARRVLDWKE